MIVRVSIGNLVPVFVAGSHRVAFPIGILNSGSYAKGKCLIQPIGGAVELTDAGRQYLVERFGAHEFHKADARFLVDDEHLEKVFEFFTARNAEMFEVDPTRELREELSEGEFPKNEYLPAIEPPLTPEEAGGLTPRFVRTVIQPFKDEAGTSPLAGKEPSRRLFHLFEVEVTTEVMAKLATSLAIRVLTDEEVATVDGGRQKGATKTGDPIADNFILP